MTQFPNSAMFWYGSFSGLWVYYAVDYDLANKYLASVSKDSKGNVSFTAFPFHIEVGNSTHKVALVNLNFMNYGAHSGVNEPTAYEDILKPLPSDKDYMPPSLGVEPATETEFSIIAYPTVRAAQIPGPSFKISDFVSGKDLTKTLGPFRLFVPCDDRIAVFWGIRNFGENKFMTHPYPYNIPCLNNPGVNIWNFTIPGDAEEARPTYDPASHTCTPNILHMTIDLSKLVPSSSNPSEILDYSMYKHKTSEILRPIGSRRNIFGNFNSYVFSDKSAPHHYKFKIGSSQGTHARAMIGALQKLLGADPQPVAAQVFQTQPVVAESGNFYVDV